MTATLDRLNAACAWLAGLAVALMMVHICADVIGKYLMNAPVPGTIAIVTQYYMPVLTFLPLAYVHHKRAHISVEVVTTRFSARLQRWLYVGALVIGCAIFGLMAQLAWGEAMSKYGIGTFALEQNWRIVTWPAYFLPFVGYGLLAIYMALQAVRYLTGLASLEPS
ncbi:MAG: TRAP transporter small permease [Gemmobacter sp.]|nr:TRAP transporter small permease [Gemmobacter sp.]